MMIIVIGKCRFLYPISVRVLRLCFLFCVIYTIVDITFKSVITTSTKATRDKMTVRDNMTVRENMSLVLALNAMTIVATTGIHTAKHKHINEQPYPFLYDPMNICTSNGAKSDPFLLVVVKSDVNHIGHRMAIRSTWGVTTTPGPQIVFLLGYSPLMKTFIKMESELYNDIIQKSFLDDYRNNTIKTMMGFYWVSSYCSGAKYVYFVDDDYIVNIKKIWWYLHELHTAGNRSIFLSRVWKNAPVVRNVRSKWYQSKKDFPGKVYPVYGNGGSMILTPDIVRKIANAFKLVKPIFIDDVYLGIVAKKLKIRLTNTEEFHHLYTPNMMFKLLSSHGFKYPKTLIEDWAKYHEVFDMALKKQ